MTTSLYVRHINLPSINDLCITFSSRSMKPFDLIHSDVWRPAPMTTSYGRRWFITFVDDYFV